MATSLVAEGLSCTVPLQPVRYHAKQQKSTRMPCLGRHATNGESLELKSKKAGSSSLVLIHEYQFGSFGHM
jgi:hypothetical protein